MLLEGWYDDIRGCGEEGGGIRVRIYGTGFGVKVRENDL